MTAMAQGWQSITTERRLDIPCTEAAHVLASSDQWLPEVVGLDGVFAPISQKITVSLGPTVRAEGCVRRHLAWQAATVAHLFPVMEGTVTVISRGNSQCVLEVIARYKPPLGRIGQLADRALLHVVAGASIERFADEVCERLAREARVWEDRPAVARQEQLDG